MNVSRYRTSAQSGLVSLEGAVMGLLYEAKVPLKPADISRYLDIPIYDRGRASAYEITHSLLYNLECRGLVRQVLKRGPWVLTQKGIESFEKS